MCIKVSLQKISLAFLALALTLSNLNANEKQLGEYESNLLLKKAFLKLYRENKELEKRLKFLNNKIYIKNQNKKK